MSFHVFVTSPSASDLVEATVRLPLIKTARKEEEKPARACIAVRGRACHAVPALWNMDRRAAHSFEVLSKHPSHPLRGGAEHEFRLDSSTRSSTAPDSSRWRSWHGPSFNDRVPVCVRSFAEKAERLEFILQRSPPRLCEQGRSWLLLMSTEVNNTARIRLGSSTLCSVSLLARCSSSHWKRCTNCRVWLCR